MNVNKAIDDINPAINPKYQPGNGLTHCNQFINALCAHPNVAVELAVALANDQHRWLGSEAAAKKGWRPCARTEAQALANKGALVLVTEVPPILQPGQKEQQHGHIAVVRKQDDSTSQPWIHIAQAGKSCFNDGPLVKGFGFANVAFWVNAGQS